MKIDEIIAAAPPAAPPFAIVTNEPLAGEVPPGAPSVFLRPARLLSYDGKGELFGRCVLEVGGAVLPNVRMDRVFRLRGWVAVSIRHAEAEYLLGRYRPPAEQAPPAPPPPPAVGRAAAALARALWPWGKGRK